MVDKIIEKLYKEDFFIEYMNTYMIDPYISVIVNQNLSGAGNRDIRFPYNQQYWIRVSDWVNSIYYIEIECGIEYSSNHDIIFLLNPVIASHGYPCSFGKKIYSFNKNTKEEEVDLENFKF